MSTSPSILHLASAVLLLLSSAAATDHIVGANKGWNPGINYTLWANNQTFYVGDLISFRYQKTQYNVFRVNKTGYDNCTTEGASGNWSSGKDFILLDKAKRYYFICGTGGCFNGMKVSVLVHRSLRHPSPPSLPSTRPRTLLHPRRRVAVPGEFLELLWFCLFGSDIDGSSGGCVLANQIFDLRRT
ncbi:UNVERIFIED_CONTAM: Blue copper protein [Sesamum angustifolium]|uniref:Blue copper protein n=1 Tax=Sesamum angustifolium TaxID=2727405 RepID=A0AAW2RLK6_9LAMI